MKFFQLIWKLTRKSIEFRLVNKNITTKLLYPKIKINKEHVSRHDENQNENFIKKNNTYCFHHKHY